MPRKLQPVDHNPFEPPPVRKAGRAIEDAITAIIEDAQHIEASRQVAMIEAVDKLQKVMAHETSAIKAVAEKLTSSADAFSETPKALSKALRDLEVAIKAQPGPPQEDLVKAMSSLAQAETGRQRSLGTIVERLHTAIEAMHRSVVEALSVPRTAPAQDNLGKQISALIAAVDRLTSDMRAKKPTRRVRMGRDANGNLTAIVDDAVADNKVH